MPVYEKFEKLLKEKSVIVAEVSLATGISASTFSDWKAGKSYPKVDKLYKIARYFQVGMEYFMPESA